MNNMLSINITEEERDEIEKLNNRKNSLKSLSLTLADSELDIDERNWFYEKLINDISTTDKLYEEWWNKTCDKYKLDKDNSVKYYVDFERMIIEEDVEVSCCSGCKTCD